MMIQLLLYTTVYARSLVTQTNKIVLEASLDFKNATNTQLEPDLFLQMHHMRKVHKTFTMSDKYADWTSCNVQKMQIQHVTFREIM